MLTASARADGRDVSEDRVREMVHDFLKSWESGDVAAFRAPLHEDLVFAYPGQRLGREDLVALFRSYQKEKTQIRIYLWDHFFVDGDRFFTAYQFAATDRETGRRQAVGTGVSGRVRDGRIVLFKEYFDNQVAARQYAGELPLDEGEVGPWPASIWLRPDTID